MRDRPDWFMGLESTDLQLCTGTSAYAYHNSYYGCTSLVIVKGHN